ADRRPEKPRTKRSSSAHERGQAGRPLQSPGSYTAESLHDGLLGRDAMPQDSRGQLPVFGTDSEDLHLSSMFWAEQGPPRPRVAGRQPLKPAALLAGQTACYQNQYYGPSPKPSLGFPWPLKLMDDAKLIELEANKLEERDGSFLRSDGSGTSRSQTPIHTLPTLPQRGPQRGPQEGQNQANAAQRRKRSIDLPVVDEAVAQSDSDSLWGLRHDAAGEDATSAFTADEQSSLDRPACCSFLEMLLGKRDEPRPGGGSGGGIGTQPRASTGGQRQWAGVRVRG
ncbi:MAG: hypothetical protein LQ340_008038, partial [Diploschistes diacapsis]